MTTSAYDALIARIEQGEQIDMQQLIQAKQADAEQTRQDAERAAIADAVAKAKAKAEKTAKATEKELRAKVKQYRADVKPLQEQADGIKAERARLEREHAAVLDKITGMYETLRAEVQDAVPGATVDAPIYINVMGHIVVDNNPVPVS